MIGVNMSANIVAVTINACSAHGKNRSQFNVVPGVAVKYISSVRSLSRDGQSPFCGYKEWTGFVTLPKHWLFLLKQWQIPVTSDFSSKCKENFTHVLLIISAFSCTGLWLVALVISSRNGGCYQQSQLQPAKCAHAMGLSRAASQGSVIVMEKPPVHSSFSQAWCCLQWGTF